jgi:hypothetical protein
MNQPEIGDMPEAARAVLDLQNELAERQHGQAADGAGACELRCHPGASSRPRCHEAKQPIGAESANAQTALRLLNR